MTTSPTGAGVRPRPHSLFRALITVAALCGVLLGCLGLCGDVTQRLAGPYLLINAYPGGDTRIAYDLQDGASVGRVPARVLAAGANEHHVIAKWRPDRVDDNGNVIVVPAPGDEAMLVRYYIIERRLDGPHVDPSACVRGPFDAERFRAERISLGVEPGLDFTVSFEADP